MKNIIVTEDNEHGSFIDIDPKAVQITDKPNVIIIKELKPNESCTLTYAVSAKDVKTDKKHYAEGYTSAQGVTVSQKRLLSTEYSLRELH